jgi:DNA-binding transcriptional regulator YdaS (Cro superfamily)
MSKGEVKVARDPIGLQGLESAVTSMGGIVPLAKAIGVSYQLVQGWRAPDRRFATPAEYCPAIERATCGAVRCEELRPDIDWAVLRKPSPAPTPDAKEAA